MNPRDILRRVYGFKSPMPRYCAEVNAVQGFGDKLGEIVMLSRIPLKAWCEGKQVYTFVNPENKFRSFYERWVHSRVEPPQDAVRATFQSIVEGKNCGPGNLLQQTYSALGLHPEIKPKGFFGIASQPKKHKVGIHIDGVGAGTLPGFPEKRDIYQRNIDVLQKFVLENDLYEFVQFGQRRPLDGVTSFLDRSLDDSVYEVATCEFMICINSSFMHIAAALDVKTVVIINNPRPDRSYFPVLVNDCLPPVPPWDCYDSYWMYPQNTHLHQDGGNPLVPEFSADNLLRALEGKVYPYFRDDWLDMIFENEYI